MDKTFNVVTYEIKQDSAWITLSRPKAFNAFLPEMNQEIIRAIKTAEKDPSVRSIVFTGEGKAFCAGQDIKTINENTDYEKLLTQNYHPMVTTIKNSAKPTIAVVNGVAAGAGMGLAIAADYRVAHEKSSFVSAFLGIALVPDSGLLYSLPRMVGYAKALDILTLDRTITGEEAYKLGIVNELFSLDNFDEEVAVFVDKISKLPTKAFSLVKKYMLDSMNEPFENLLEKEAYAQKIASISNDHQEGLQAFMEKRKPNFTSE